MTAPPEDDADRLLAPPMTPERAHVLGVVWLRSRGWEIARRNARGIVVEMVDQFGGRPVPIGHARSAQRYRDISAHRRSIGCRCPGIESHAPGCKFYRASERSGPRPSGGGTAA